ncbi:MAG: hypothetical protein ACJ768_07105 [Gaiellaceae bacterium]
MKTLIIAAIAVAALTGAGVAVAHGIDGGAQSVSAVTGSFTATSVTGSETRSCTTSTGKTIASTKATYTGTASGSPDLTGAATIAARSTIDTTDGIGVVDGTLKIGKTESHFSAVYDHGSVAGMASGHGATPHLQLLANVSATFSTTAGFTGGKIGGTAGGSAVELVPGGCKSSHETSDAEGSITAVSATSITVAGLTCTVPVALSTKVLALALGTRVEIKCSLSNGTTTLVKIGAKSGH